MHSLKISYLFIFGLYLLPSFVLADEQILNYVSDIIVHENAELTVTETITVKSEGENIKRGIYRDFPTDYYDHYRNRVHVGFEVVRVLRDNKQEAFHTERLYNGVRVYIGKSNRILPPGIYEYSLTYRTNRQLGFFEKSDELYFNAIGHGWIFPILQGTVIVKLPDKISSAEIHTDGYTGVQGSIEKAFTARTYPSGHTEFVLNRILKPNEGFTVVVSWPKGFIKPLSKQEQIHYFLNDNIDTAVGAVCACILFIYLFLVWRAVGRDPKSGIIFPQFEAPEKMSAYAVRYVSRMKYDNKCFVVALLGMALKGYIQIAENKGGIFNFLTSYKLNRTKQKFAVGDEVERSISGSLFSGSQETFELDGKNYSALQSASRSVERDLEKKYFTRLFLTNSHHAVIAWGAVFLSGLFMFVAARFEPNQIFRPINALVFIFILLQTIFFGIIVKVRTRVGRSVMDHIEGYRMYLKAAEEDRLKFLVLEELTPQLFEAHLLYAIALDCEEEWTKHFQSVLAKTGQNPDSYHPSWYVGTGSFNSGYLALNSISSSFSGAVASSSTPPGSSSGSSGGGSSGGGGGGGGGGGW